MRLTRTTHPKAGSLPLVADQGLVVKIWRLAPAAISAAFGPKQTLASRMRLVRNAQPMLTLQQAHYRARAPPIALAQASEFSLFCSFLYKQTIDFCSV